MADRGRETLRLMAYELKQLTPDADGATRTRTLRQVVAEYAAATRTMARARPLIFAGSGNVVAVVFVAAALYVVHGIGASGPGRAENKSAPAQSAAPTAAPQERAFHGALPPNVTDMRAHILLAAHAGDLDELKTAIEWNEIPPDFGPKAGDDPFAYWRGISGDGKGLEVLARAADLFALPPARLALGRDPENSFIYVWPYLAELPLDTLTPAEEVDLLRLMSADEAKAMRAAKKWTWWRIAIGADGTWHTFRKFD